MVAAPSSTESVAGNSPMSRPICGAGSGSARENSLPGTMPGCSELEVTLRPAATSRRESSLAKRMFASFERQ